MIKKYALYLLRWQCSTPILAVVLILMSNFNPTIATVVANFIGGLIFFWIDKFIFRTRTKVPLWEIMDDTICSDCGKSGRGYRIVEWRGYNRRKITGAQFRCETCKNIKMEKVKMSLK